MDEKAKTFYVTFATGQRILGYMSIDRKTFAVVPNANAMKLSADDFESLVSDLKAGKVVGKLGEMKWQEGRAEGADPPESSKSNW